MLGCAGAVSAEFLPNPTTVDLPQINVLAGSSVEVRLEIEGKNGAKLTTEAPCRLKVRLGSAEEGAQAEQRITSEITKLSLNAPGIGEPADIRATAVLYYCKISDKSLCYLKSFIFNQPVKLVTVNSSAVNSPTESERGESQAVTTHNAVVLKAVIE